MRTGGPVLGTEPPIVAPIEDAGARPEEYEPPPAVQG
jgi:hypothetical protein